MRLHEITQADQYFFGSKTSFQPGHLLKGRAPRFSEPEEKAVETILEHYRPASCLPRYQSVFMVDKPDEELIDRVGGYSTYIYLVKPNGPVERNDVGWWTEVLLNGAYEFADGDESVLIELKEICLNYWLGKASASPNWEYRTPSATIIKDIKALK